MNSMQYTNDEVLSMTQPIRQNKLQSNSKPRHARNERNQLGIQTLVEAGNAPATQFVETPTNGISPDKFN